MIRIVFIILVCSISVLAQQIGNPTTQQGVIPPRGTFAIRNARIVTVSGADIENGTVVIRDGKIEAVGTNVNVPAGSNLKIVPPKSSAGAVPPELLVP